MNSSPLRRIWLWQNIFSPHMAGLAVALARLGCEVTYIAERAMTDDRLQQGWKPPVLDGVTLQLMASTDAVEKLVTTAEPDCIHICSGIRANGMVGVAQRALAMRSQKLWLMMETVHAAGWQGALKRLVYRRLFMRSRRHLFGALAIGYTMPAWVAARGVPANLIFPFAYFLPDAGLTLARIPRKPGPFRFVFAGQLIPRKRVDWLIEALSHLTDKVFELWIIGTGPNEPALRTLSAHIGMGARVHWLGQLPLTEVPSVLAQADCLVLPSVHDGWGAVVSEALMVGTPVICSNACGSAGAVRASNFGGVFSSSDKTSLTNLLELVLAKGPMTLDEKVALAEWASCLGGTAGAAYLLRILDHAEGRIPRPLPPWEPSMISSCSGTGTYHER